MISNSNNLAGTIVHTEEIEEYDFVFDWEPENMINENEFKEVLSQSKDINQKVLTEFLDYTKVIRYRKFIIYFLRKLAMKKMVAQYVDRMQKLKKMSNKGWEINTRQNEVF